VHNTFVAYSATADSIDIPLLADRVCDGQNEKMLESVEMLSIDGRNWQTMSTPMSDEQDCVLEPYHLNTEKQYILILDFNTSGTGGTAQVCIHLVKKIGK
jgi:hypothetical protein